MSNNNTKELLQFKLKEIDRELARIWQPALLKERLLTLAELMRYV